MVDLRSPADMMRELFFCSSLSQYYLMWSNTEVNQPVEMTPFVINYYGRLGRRRLHFVNLIMPAATQWLDPFP